MLPDALRKSIDTSPVEMDEDAIRAYIKRLMDVQRCSKSSPMDIGRVNEDWKPEAEEQSADHEPPLCSYQHHHHYQHDQYDIGAVSKGKSNKGKGKGKNFSGCYLCGGDDLARDCKATPQHVGKFLQSQTKGKGKGIGYQQQAQWPGHAQYGKSKCKGYKGMYNMSWDKHPMAHDPVGKHCRSTAILRASDCWRHHVVLLLGCP